MGARVEIAQDGENLVRMLEPGPRAAPDCAVPSHPIALVAAQGLPNLLHELVHAVLAGRLDDDHGIDYGAIPFALDTIAGRTVLWDELSCCVISCAYLWAHGRAARAQAPASVVQAEVHAWFREQVEIQPVFYGMDDDPAGFVPRVMALVHEHHAEATAVLARAYAATARALQDAGADPRLSTPPRRPSMASMFVRARPEPREHA